MLIRLLKSFHPNGDRFKVKDKVVGQFEIQYNNQAPRVVLLNGETYSFAYSIHEDGPPKALWHCYRPVESVDLTEAPNVPFEAEDAAE